ncbi:PIN domain-like protein, partial [Meira miltonrushii]
MGITGLLPLLKDVSEHIHIKKYKGKVLGVDGYVWLHRGAYGCAEALALGKPTTKYVEYAMSQIHMLMHHGIIPYIVFDGDRLPAKARTEHDRHQRREECLEQARKYALAGNQKEAREQYARCVDVTPTMAYQLIKRLRESKIQYIVAPYEADAQLAYLERRGVIDGIVTEDSDLLVFGCKTVLYKLDREGNCVEYLHSNRQKCKSLAMHSFDDSMFRQMAILSGCDYLPSIPKMGLKTANQMLRQYGSVARVLNVALTMGMQVPTNYREQFERAERTFVYQRVF